MANAADFILLASYNRWMNDKLYAAAATLPAAELHAQRGAFFGSLMGTLNHIVAGDTIWLQRFATHPVRHAALDPVRAMDAPARLDAMFSDALPALAARRRTLDHVIEAWARELSQADLEHVLHYQNSKGVVAEKRLSDLLLHFFNHQTHHRGQASTLLSQAGVDLGVTDLLALIAEHKPA